MNQPTRVILHCSATPDKGDYIGATQIDEWHRERGWHGIGYHFVIRRSGVLERGRDEKIQGAHTKGHNRDSLGVCFIGTSDFTTEQISSLKVLYKDLKNRYNIDADNWFCHYQFANKDCPNIPVSVLRELLRLS